MIEMILYDFIPRARNSICMQHATEMVAPMPLISVIDHDAIDYFILMIRLHNEHTAG